MYKRQDYTCYTVSNGACEVEFQRNLRSLDDIVDLTVEVYSEYARKNTHDTCFTLLSAHTSVYVVVPLFLPPCVLFRFPLPIFSTDRNGTRLLVVDRSFQSNLVLGEFWATDPEQAEQKITQLISAAGPLTNDLSLIHI